MRFSLLALFVFVTLVCLLLGWWVQPRRYVVEALFQLSASQPVLLGDSDRAFDAREFDLFRETQVDLITSDFLLMAALRGVGIAALPVLKNQDDQVAWLRDRLEVAVTDESELLSIRVRCTEGETNDCRQIVDSVAKAYLNEVVFADEQRKMVERDVLAKSVSRLKEELVQTMALLPTEAEGKSEVDPDVVMLRMDIEVLGEVWREMLRELEVLDVNAAGPLRVQQIQPATSRPE